MSKPTGFKGSRTWCESNIMENVHFSECVTEVLTTETGFVYGTTDREEVREMQGPRQLQDTPSFVAWLQERYPLTMLPNFDYTKPAAYMSDWAPNA